MTPLEDNEVVSRLTNVEKVAASILQPEATEFYREAEGA